MQSNSIIFFVYAIQDEKAFQAIQTQLIPATQAEKIAIGSNQHIGIGKHKTTFLHESLEKAKVVVLLLSSHFLSQTSIVALLEQAHKGHQEGRLQLIPILLDHCLWKKTPIANLQFLPKDNTPICDHSNPTKIFKEVAKSILQAFQKQPLLEEEEGNLLALLPYPFSNTFAQHVFSKTQWATLKNQVVQTANFWKPKDASLLPTASTVSDKHIGGIAQTLLKVAITAFTNNDLANSLHILTLYFEKWQEPTVIQKIAAVFLRLELLQLQPRKAVLPILDRLDSLLEKMQLSNNVKAKVTLKLANDFNKLNLCLDKATIHAQKALAIFQETTTLDSLEVADCLETLGLIALEEGKWKQAVQYYEQTLQIRKKHLPIYHFQLAVLYWRISNPCTRLNLLEKAEKYLADALEIYSHLPLKQRNPKFLAALYTNLNFLYQTKGEYENALQIVLEAKDIKEQLYRANSLQLGSAYSDLAINYYFKSNYVKAIALFEKVLKIRMQNLGNQHPYTISTTSNLATSYRAKRLYDKAFPLFEQVQTFLQKQNHPDAFIFYAEIGKYHLALKDYKSAQHFFDLSLQQINIHFGEDTIDTAHYLHDVGRIYQQKKEYPTALELLETALELKKELLTDNHLFIANTLQCIGEIKVELKDYSTALELFQQVLSIRKEKLGRNNQKTAEILCYIADLHLQQENLEAAHTHYQDCLKIYKHLIDINQQIIVYAKIIHTHIQLSLLTTNDFQDTLYAFLHLLKMNNSTDNPSRTTAIEFFKQHHTFNEYLAEKILGLVAYKAEFQAFMQELDLLLPLPEFSVVENLEVLVAPPKASVNQSAKIKSLMEKIRKGVD